MHWDDLKVLLAVARRQSLVAAANQLKVNETTVGRRLRGLEDALGSPLFLRRKGRLIPSELCERLLEHAERIEGEAMAMQRRAQGRNDAPVGCVRVSSQPWLVRFLLLPLLADFTRLQPQIELDLIGSTRRRNLHRREADLELRFEAGPLTDEICLPVASLSYSLYGPADARDGEAPWLGFGDDIPEMTVATGHWYDANLSPVEQARLRFNDAGLMYEAIRLGLGKGLIPDHIAAEDAGLRRLSGPAAEIWRTLRILVHKDVATIPRVALVIDWLKDATPPLQPATAEPPARS